VGGTHTTPPRPQHLPRIRVMTYASIGVVQSPDWEREHTKYLFYSEREVTVTQLYSYWPYGFNYPIDI